MSNDHPNAAIRTIETATHEAGHAVAAVLLGLRVERVSMDQTETTLGGVSVPQCEGDVPPDRVPACVIVAAAGVSANRPQNQWGRDVLFGSVASNDAIRAEALLRSIGHNGDALDREWTAANRSADELLATAAHWCAVEAVAAALMGQGTLSGDEVARIVEDIAAEKDAPRA